MSDYIKREDAKELFDMLLEHYHDTGVEVIRHTAAIAPKEFHISEEDDIADFSFEIDAWKKDFSNIQSADVVQVIRCKDCKYYDTPKNFKKPYCMRGAYVKVNADDYCSKGERK